MNLVYLCECLNLPEVAAYWQQVGLVAKCLDYNLTLLSFVFMFLLSVFSLLLLTIYLLFFFIIAKQPGLYPPFYVKLPYHGKALNSLICADVPLRSCSLIHLWWFLFIPVTAALRQLPCMICVPCCSPASAALL